MEANWDTVTQARQQAEAQAQSATEFGARGNTLADELRKAIGERFGQSDIAKQSAEARAGFLSAAPQARTDISNLIQGGAILSPTQQQSIMAAKRGAALVPVMGTNLIQEAAFGSLEDLINAGTNAYNAEVQRQQGLAQLAQGSYSNILNELIQKAQIENQQQQLALQKQNANKKNYSTIEVNGRIWSYDPSTGTLLNDLGTAYHAGGGSTAATEKTKANEIKQWLSTQTNSRTEAEKDKRSLLAKGYDLNTIDNVIDSLYPIPKTQNVNQWEAQQYVFQQAAIIQNQQGDEAAAAYIRGQGFNPEDYGLYGY